MLWRLAKALNLPLTCNSAKWRIYYGDGAVYDAAPELAPASNVQAIISSHDVLGRQLCAGRDFYWWDAGEWWGGDIVGLIDYLNRPGWKKVLAGRSIKDQTYIDVCNAARSDPDFQEIKGAPSGWME